METLKLYCSVDVTLCDGICAELHQKECPAVTQGDPSARRGRKQKRQDRRQERQEDDDGYDAKVSRYSRRERRQD